MGWRLDGLTRRLTDVEAALRRIEAQQEAILRALLDMRRPAKVQRQRKSQLRLPLHRLQGNDP